MNFFGHAVVARWSLDESPFLLGTMLPDLSGMLGLRLTRATPAAHPAVQAGIEHHYATDDAFHNCTPFVRLCNESLEGLTALGVERGTARAVAHVGIELLLDGLLSRNEADLEAYRAALAFAVEKELASTLSWKPEDQQRMHAGLARLQQAPVPVRYAEPAFVVDRLQFILSHRPRLAIRDSDLPHVSARIHELSKQVQTEAPQILAEVRARLTS